MAKKPLKKKKQVDPLISLKYIAYCRAFTPPGEDTSREEFVEFAKFFLCKQTRRLWKDPIWDDYTEEEILIEYFAHLFSTNAQAKSEFEVKAFSGSDIYGEDVFEWLDRMVKENQEDMAKKLDALPEKVSFSPETNVDKEE